MTDCFKLNQPAFSIVEELIGMTKIDFNSELMSSLARVFIFVFMNG